MSRWNNTRLLGGGDGDAIEAIRSLRASGGDGGVQVWGSASLARQLVENDLVDEYQLMVEPILLGGGKKIFPAYGGGRASGSRKRTARAAVPPRRGSSAPPTRFGTEGLVLRDAIISRAALRGRPPTEMTFAHE